jgi:uncharacterized protein with gpF-like domain
MARTLTGNSRRREQRLQSLMLDRLVQKYERRLASEIKRSMTAAGKAYQSGEPVSATMALHKTRLSAILSTLWTDSARTMSQHILGTEKALYAMEQKRQFSEVSPTTITDSIMRAWIATTGTEKITQITNTTQSDIRNVINRGIEEGLPETDIARMIFAIAPTKSASRAQTIARTETHAASQAAAQATAEAIDLQMTRVWVSAQGERTREDHIEADGQRRGMYEPFDIGGDSIMYPGDPSGSAGQVINCRCCVVYEIGE